MTVQDWGITSPANRVINSATGEVVPQRIRLSRKKGFRLPLNAKSVARPSKWGNPFRSTKYWRSQVWTVVGPDYNPCLRLDAHEARRIAVEQFEAWIPDHWRGRRGLIAIELRGLDLACYCPLPEPGEIDWCHAAVLVREANQ